MAFRSIVHDIPKSELAGVFFDDLKRYNHNNFATLLNSDVSECSPEIAKCFSSVITRYFIFMEYHREVSETDGRILYYALRLDLIARYFTEYPIGNVDDLKAFQDELYEFVTRKVEGENGRFDELQATAV
jgi:hypothetical protein